VVAFGPNGQDVGYRCGADASAPGGAAAEIGTCRTVHGTGVQTMKHSAHIRGGAFRNWLPRGVRTP